MVDHVLEFFEYSKYTLGVLSTYLKHLIQSTIQYFLKNWNYMVYLTETARGLKSIYQIGNNPFK